MVKKKLLSENGQTLVLVVIGLLAFIAMLALVLDGGNAYAAKRQAQNAADSGALAGAQYMCQHRLEAGVLSAAVQKAQDYAGYNGADNYAQVSANLSAATVVVTATVTKDTFFAGVIGYPTVAPRAVAEAACRPPAVGVLPVAWSCRENVVGEIKCTEDLGPCRTPSDPKGLKCTYILMDSVKVKEKNKNCDPNDPSCYTQNDLECSVQTGTPPNCSPADTTKIDCDLDNDCVDELATGGARSWLDLDGSGGGANELKDWINGSVAPPEISVHTWLPEESGVATSIFHTTASNLVGKVVVLPVFDKVCNGLPTLQSPETTSYCKAGSIDTQSYITSSTLNFHVISFSAFHVTCVQTGKNKTTAEPGYFLSPSDKSCYGHEWATTDPPGPVGPSIDDNDKTIEGYFVRENLGGYSGPGDWYDTGTFTVVLVR
jgi:hypothetical protein